MPRPNTKPLTPLDIGDRVRFITRVTIKTEAECWPWTGGVTPEQYGAISLRVLKDGVPQGGASGWAWQLASRVAYLFFYGSDPGESCVLHTCDNPPCCNPYHLFLGTIGQNNRDRAVKLRTKGTKLNPEIISEVFGMSKQGLSSRQIAAALAPLGYSIDARTIRNALKGETWAWLGMAK